VRQGENNKKIPFAKQPSRKALKIKLKGDLIMKIKKSKKRLSLNKDSIANLGLEAMDNSRGGLEDPFHTLIAECASGSGGGDSNALDCVTQFGMYC
jgi:hypothetical protein